MANVIVAVLFLMFGLIALRQSRLSSEALLERIAREGSRLTSPEKAPPQEAERFVRFVTQKVEWWFGHFRKEEKVLFVSLVGLLGANALAWGIVGARGKAVESGAGG